MYSLALNMPSSIPVFMTGPALLLMYTGLPYVMLGHAELNASRELSTNAATTFSQALFVETK